MSPPTLLLVEDDLNDRLLLRRALSKLGARWQVQEVGDGENALRYLQGLPPFTDRSRYPLLHLILLDLKLPRRSGWEVLAWMRQRPPSAKSRWSCSHRPPPRKMSNGLMSTAQTLTSPNLPHRKICRTSYARF